MKRFTKKLIYHWTTIAIFWVIFSNIALLLFDGDFKKKINWIFYLLLVIVINIYSILYYKFSGYLIEDNRIICKKGVIFKKKSILDFSKINSINKKQSLIHKIFGISLLMIDSGSTNTSSEAEIVIIEDTKIVNKLYNLLKDKDNINKLENCDLEQVTDIKQNEFLYKFNSKAKFIYSIFGGLYSIVISFFIVLFIFITIYLLHKFQDFNIEFFFNLFEKICCSVLLFLILVLIGWLISLLFVFIRYYNFKITKINDSINVKQGLFTENHNSFMLDKIKAVLIYQNLIQRLFNYAKVKVEVIGYVKEISDDKTQQIGILIPFCKLSEVNSYLEKIIPTHIPKPQKNHAISLMSFISWPFIIISIITLVVGIFASIILTFYNLKSYLMIVLLSIIVLYFILNFLNLINALFGYKNKDIIIDEKNVTLCYGTITKKIAVINRKDIIAIEDITTKFRAEKGIYSYVIHFYTNSLSNTIKIDFKEESLKEKLLNIIEF